MRRTLVVGLGTAASGAVLHFRRRREGELRRLRRGVAAAAPELRARLEARVAALEGGIRLLSFDLDGTNAYLLPPPLDAEDADWGVGEAHKVTLHPGDVLSRLRTGQLPWIDQVNPESLRGLDADNASGGAPANSDLAFAVSRDQICSALRQNIMALLENRQVSAGVAEGGRVLLVAGTFGGTGTGAYQRVLEWLLQVTEELGVSADVCPLLLVPGAHLPKDARNSYANTFALLKELAAGATEFCWKPGAEGDGSQRTAFRAPFLITDSNNAPGNPRLVSQTGFGALVGNLLYELATTSLGNHLDGQLGDFGVAGSTPTRLGEPRQARTLGYSSVFLDLDRQELFSGSVVASRFAEAALKEAPERVVREDIKSFFEARVGLLAGDCNLLAIRLLDFCAAHEGRSLVRLSMLFGRATENLTGAELLAEGRNRLALACQHCGDFGPALQRHAAEMSAGIGPAVSAELRRMVCDPARGPASARQWLCIAGGVVDATLAAAGTALGQKQAEVNKLEGRIHEAETKFGRQRGLLYQALHGAELNRAGAAYRADLETWAATRIRCQAMSAAVQVLNRLRQVVQNELRQTVQPMLAAVGAYAEAARADGARAINHSVEFGCPNGLPLLAGEADLVELHSRLFPKEDEEKIVAELFGQLSQRPEPESVLKDATALGRFVAEKAPSTLLGARLEGVNVVDEFRRRFCAPALLGAALRERDLEAYERLPLVSTSDQTSGVTLVRWAGISGDRVEAIRAALEKYPTERGTRYLPVDTGDRQRLTFLQVRAVFPFSDWRSMGAARSHYEAIAVVAEAERQHVSPGSRFLPTPGKPLSEEEVGILLARAWMLERLEWRNDAGWLLLPGSATETPLCLGPAAVVPAQLAYRAAVDLVSAMNCQVRRHGVQYLRRRLEDLARAQPNGGPPLPASVPLSRVVRRLRDEADWWERNAHRAAAGSAPADASANGLPKSIVYSGV